jgi:hypothetical protein
MSKQKLDLLQFAASNVAQARTRAVEIAWHQLRQAELRCVVFHNAPDHSVSHKIATGLSSSTHIEIVFHYLCAGEKNVKKSFHVDSRFENDER